MKRTHIVLNTLLWMLLATQAQAGIYQIDGTFTWPTNPSGTAHGQPSSAVGTFSIVVDSTDVTVVDNGGAVSLAENPWYLYDVISAIATFGDRTFLTGEVATSPYVIGSSVEGQFVTEGIPVGPSLGDFAIEWGDVNDDFLFLGFITDQGAPGGGLESVMLNDVELGDFDETQFFFNGQYQVTSVTLIPEPASAALLLMVGIAALARSRRP